MDKTDRYWIADLSLAEWGRTQGCRLCRYTQTHRPWAGATMNALWTWPL